MKKIISLSSFLNSRLGTPSSLSSFLNYCLGTLFLILFLHCSINTVVGQTIDGKWDGSISIAGTELGISVNFLTNPDSIRGTIDIPQQGAKDLPLMHMNRAGDKLYFELQAGQSVAVFDGVFAKDSVGGKFTQSGLEGTFFLKRAVEEKKDTVPYKQEEVTFSNGDNTFAGTLTIPETNGKHPAVVMITGSGPQNRDEELFGFKPFAIIADRLTRNGIAVLRYDDRGIGGSKGKGINESTTEDFAYDVIEAVKFLKSRSDINPEQIGLIGHSEGGIVAPLAATRYDGIDFLVLMAGTGVSGREVILEQSKLILKAEGSTDKEVETQNKMILKAFDAIKTEKGWADIKESIEIELKESYDKMSEEEKKMVKDKDDWAKKRAEAQVKQLQSTWFRYFVGYDPSKALEKVKCPVLMLFGEKDLQVPPKQSQGPMEEALQRGGNSNFKTMIFPNANHLFLTATTGSPTEYSKLTKEFVPSFLDTMTSWILEQIAK